MTWDMQRALCHSVSRHDTQSKVNVGPHKVTSSLHFMHEGGLAISCSCSGNKRWKPEALTSDLYCLNIAQEWRKLLFFLIPRIAVLSVLGVSAVQRLRSITSEQGTIDVLLLIC